MAKLDIFETLAAIDARDHGWLSRKPDEERKGFHPPVVLRWASVAADGPLGEYYLTALNRKVNPSFHSLSKHPDLQFRLLAACGAGEKQRHGWIDMPKGSYRGDKVTDFLHRFWPDANGMEIGILLSQFTRETFQEFLEHSGTLDTDIREVMTAYDRLYGHETEEKPKKRSKRK